jgi:hypothetical protein
MRCELIFITALLLCSRAVAEESCAVRAGKLLASGQTAELAKWFSKPDKRVADQLLAVASQIGPLTDLSEVAQPISGATTRVSIASSAQPATYSFFGSWASAKSERFGAIQIQAASESSADCKLLALHIHKQQQ